jgi:hypothetical protein
MELKTAALAAVFFSSLIYIALLVNGRFYYLIMCSNYELPPMHLGMVIIFLALFL